jgi:hypothetical protein
MKTISKYILLSIITVFVSCKEEETKKPKVNYDTRAKTEPQSAEVNTILVADLPVQMEGTSVLIHPIGEFNVANGPRSKYSSGSGEKDSFVVSNASEYEITGYLSNLKFQSVDSDSLHVLTNKPMMIERVTYLKTIADKTRKQFLVYVLEDMDSNKDDKLDSNDIRNLYMSDILGNNFTKLSAEFQELIDWNLIESQNRIYFRTIEDINKNGAFDKDDKVHYHFIDLLAKEMKAEEYLPVN